MKKACLYSQNSTPKAQISSEFVDFKVIPFMTSSIFAIENVFDWQLAVPFTLSFYV